MLLGAYILIQQLENWNLYLSTAMEMEQSNRCYN